jgi:hypothetical protein
MNWDGQNPAREHGEWLIACIEEASRLKDANPPFTFSEPKVFSCADGKIVAKVSGIADAADQLQQLSKSFLNWSGKAERLSFDVPTLPLFIHERLSTQAIIETLKSHRKDAAQTSIFDLFGDPQRPLADAITKAYEHPDKWVNRLILGDSLVVMNSLLQYEGMGGQVQMIYIDPPYGVKFGSNFQPFVRKKDVSANDDEDMTREPEMVKAYRDTWELGLHSYLTYLRDRLTISRELLHTSGSVFVQISDENLHNVTQLMDEIFGRENFVSIIPFRKKTMPLGAQHLESICDYLIWYARDKEQMKFNKVYVPMTVQGDNHWNYVEMSNGSRRRMTSDEIANHQLLPNGADRPDEQSGVTRVAGAFCFEATIPTPLDLDGDGEPDDGTDSEDRTSFVDRLLDTLRRAPILQLAQGRTVMLRSIRPPAKTLALSAEAMVDATAEGQKVGLGDIIAVADEQNRNTMPFSQRAVAIVFGPENGAVSERLVYEAAQEASAKKYTHLYIFGFAIQPNAEHLIGQCEIIFDLPATWVPVTPDVIMGDLLKTTRASQIFSVAGRPEVALKKLALKKASDTQRWQVILHGLDTFDPITMEVDKLKGDDVPCWMLDTDYNGRVFHANQVFFPRTKAWQSLKTALKATHDASVWDHLAGTTSAPFEAGEQNIIAVKVIDDRGNEMMVVKKFDEVP